jgi:choline dehydrogenase
MQGAAGVTLAAEWDYIVVGAGSAGAALAATLAQRNVGTVLLLEAGKRESGRWFRLPIGVAMLLLGERGVTRYFTAEQPGLDARRIYWPRGTGPGGSSQVNGMIWARGDPAEYDRWAAQGLPGWSYDDLLPYFRASERYEGAGSRTRGRDGATPVAIYSPADPLTRGFLDACAALGWRTLDDYNDGVYEGAGLLQLNTLRGLRFSTRDAYLDPAAGLPNFRLVNEAPVTGIVLSEGRSVGVSCAIDGQLHRLTARREVVVCGGAIQSPQLLELSGIGEPARLQSLGLTVRHPLAAVGENLLDHLHVRLNLRAHGVQTVNDLQRRWSVKVAQGLRFALHRDGLLSTATCTAHALVRSREDDPQADLKLQLHLVTGADVRSASGYELDPFPGFSIGLFQLRPHSRGSVHIVSPRAADHPAIDPRYLCDARDRDAVLHGLRVARRLAAQPALARFVRAELRPGADARSEDELMAYIRASGTTSYHPVGTCRLGAPGVGVVDARLRVHGLRGLRVADASVLPTLPSSNTNAPAIAVGLKAADMIAEDARAAVH